MTTTLPNTREMQETIHAVAAEIDATFTWDYERSLPALGKLYEKAKTSQWNVTTDLPWDTDVDPEKVAHELSAGTTTRFQALQDLPNSPVANFGDKEWLEVGVEIQSSLLSQFLHGEQGALLCTARIVETVPWIDAKYYASTQVMDEARHVEVFGRYLDEKLTSQYRINDNLKTLLDDILSDSRWDITYLGMQIMVEGLALAAFGLMHQLTTEPLLKQMLRYVMSDEARHVAFGVISLKELYGQLTSAELRERQEFAYETAVRLKRRFIQTEVWERMGVDPSSIIRAIDENPPPQQQMFQTMLFSKIVPNCKKLGLLDAADGWLREKFTDIGIIQFEDWVDTGEEYEQLDEVARDRAAAG
jgi:hypothetical protein